MSSFPGHLAYKLYNHEDKKIGLGRWGGGDPETTYYITNFDLQSVTLNKTETY